MALPLFDSFDVFYKAPFGAVAAGQPLRLRLALPPWLAPAAVAVQLAADGCPWGEAAVYPMQPLPAREGCAVYGCRFAAPAPGLYFYRFTLKDGGCVVCAGCGRGVYAAGEGQPFQLTVYDGAAGAPQGFAGGVMYQIFPDRFFEGRPGKAMPFADRIYRQNKRGTPYFWPNEQPQGYINRDYFGGDLEGIRQKLPYLAGLGVTCLYLNPIFEAHSNHRYNTADYLRVDPLLGDVADFEALCRDAHARGIRVLLDGVFSHTGSDSLYFNREGRYPTRGAYAHADSPWRSWYVFGGQYTGGYRSWWGFLTLPEVDENDPGYRAFICGEDGVLRTWLRRGADGWRLDVADELPDDFIADIRRAVKAEGPDKLLLGEVWEDATTKVSYGHRRRYLLGGELDTVMNYPWREAVLRFVREGDGAALAAALMQLCENYPPAALHTLMNMLGTHDTARVLTQLAGEPADGHDRAWQSATHLSEAARGRGQKLVRLATALQFFLPGVPCIYYGDEVYMEGYRDPFNRAYFDWEHPPTDLQRDIRRLAALRRDTPALRCGRLQVLAVGRDMLALLRTTDPAAASAGWPDDEPPAPDAPPAQEACAAPPSAAVLLLNRGDAPVRVALPWGGVLEAGALQAAFAVREDRLPPDRS